MIKPDAEGLSASGELVPENLKGEVKPVRLTCLFDVKEVFDNVVCYDAINKEYFINGTQVTYKALQKLVDRDYPHVDLDKKIASLISEGLFDSYQK